jgi:ketosteroid isomerase-like protein
MTPEDTVLAVGQLADERNWNGLRDLFAPSVTFHDGQPRNLSNSELVGEWRAELSAYDRTTHRIHDLSLMVDRDKADCISQFSTTYWMVGLPGGDSWTLHGEYIHKLTRTDDGWRITGMRVTPLDTEGNIDIRELAEREATAFAKNFTRRRHRHVLDDFFNALEKRDVDAFTDVWHPDATLETPFAPDDQPTVIEGTDAITRHYARWLGQINNLRFNLSIIDTLDPSKFIVVYTDSFNGTTHGGHFHSHHVAFFDIRDRKILTLTDYSNPNATRTISQRLHPNSDHSSNNRPLPRPPVNR